MAQYPFNDASSFGDFVVFAQTYLPDRFRPREGAGPDQQWNLERAFDGLRHGLAIVAQERGARFNLQRARSTLEEAYGHYAAKRERDGFEALEKLRGQLR